jgi:hypothetical protein
VVGGGCGCWWRWLCLLVVVVSRSAVVVVVVVVFLFVVVAVLSFWASAGAGALGWAFTYCIPCEGSGGVRQCAHTLLECPGFGRAGVLARPPARALVCF